MKSFNLLANTGSQLAVVASATLSTETVDHITSKGYQLPIEDGQQALYVAVRLSETLGLLTQEAVAETQALVFAYRSDAVDLNQMDPTKAYNAAWAASEVAHVVELLNRHHATVVQNDVAV